MFKVWNNFNVPMKLITTVFFFTFVHHLYGGVIYDTPGRIVGAIGFAAFYAITWWFYQKRGRAVYSRLFWMMAIVLWVGLIGLYEGGYNHTLYLALWYGQDSHSLLHFLYPEGGEVAEPTSVFFEATGVLTFLAAAALAVSAMSVMRKQKKR